MMKLFLKDKTLLAVLLFTTVTFFIYLFKIIGEGVLDPGDGLKHFFYAKYSWEQPSLLLNHWAKPLFTLLSSPFAQLGFKGMTYFNILLFLIVSIGSYKICQLLNLKHCWVVIIFCFSAPIYFWLILSGMTEVLFSALVIIAVYFFIKKNYFWGVIILSFLPFSRPESAMVIPWYLLFLILKKEYKYIPLIITGTFVYSVVGSFHYNDLFWVITHRPYSSTGTYGSGEFFHFILSYKSIAGTISTSLFVIGGGLLLVNLIKKKFKEIQQELIWVLLVLFPIVSVVFVHSLVWWKGMQGSAGYIRVIGTVVPLIALVSVYSLNKIISILDKLKYKETTKIQFAIVSLLVIVTTYIGLNNVMIDKRFLVEQKVLVDVSEWYKQFGDNKKIYYMPPYFAYKANLNPFSEHGNMEHLKHLKNKKTPSESIKNGEFILWENQYARVEGKFKLEDLSNDKGLKHIKTFYPEKEVKFYGQKYTAELFQKIN